MDLSEFDGSSSRSSFDESFFASATGDGGSNMILPPPQRASAAGRDDGIGLGSSLRIRSSSGSTSPQSKRTARGKACERCRRMKIKCDGATPACATCRKRALNCIFAAVEKPQKPKRREEYVKALENRLNRVETLLKASGILDGKRAAPDVTGHVDYDVDIDALLAEAGEPAESSLPSDSNKSQDFWKHSIWQTKRPGWINDIIEDVVARSLGPPVSINTQMHDPEARRFGQYARLPPMEDVLSLVADFFLNINNLFPLYHEETFMKQLHENMPRAGEAAGWLASINTVLALGHISRMRSTFLPQEQEKEGWRYMKNAMAVQSELPVLDFDLLSVQALIGMMIFMLITSCNSQMPSMMLAAAIRVAQGIGLHINCDDPKMSEVDKEQRRRVFWIAYIFDRELSLRTGRAPVQNNADMNVPLPQNNPPDQTGYIGGFNMFRARCAFAQIQGKVYKQLYSDQAWTRPRDDVLAAVAALDRELEAWRQGIPSDLRPGDGDDDDDDDDDGRRRPPLPDLPAPYDSNVLILHFCYWYCFGLVHRRRAICASASVGVSVAGDGPDALAPPGSASRVADSARSAVRLLRHHPPGAKGTRWYLLYYCAAALVNLFGEVIDEASVGGGAAAEAAEADLSRMRVVLRFMAVVCEEGNRDARTMFGMCRELERIAADCLGKAATAAAARNGVSPSSSSSNGEGEEQRGRREREIVAVRKQLRVHGRFFAPMDV